MPRVAIKLTESWGVSGGKHDAAAGVVSSVKVLGLVSLNGRRYSPQATKAAVPLIENAAVYVDHPDERPVIHGAAVPRSILKRFARLKGVHSDDKGELYADLHYRKKHWFAEQFADLVDNDPVGIGLSINAHGFGSPQPDGTMLVEEISKVHSVDLVDGPATCGGLWEQYAMDETAAGAAPALGDTGGDWRAQVGELLKSIAMDSTLDKGAMKTKIMAALKLLDDPAESAEPKTESDVMEQLRGIPHPAARKAVKVIGRQLRRKQAADAGLPEVALTEQFVNELVASPEAEVGARIMERVKLIQAVKTPTSAAPSPTGGPTPPTKPISELREQLFGDLAR